MRYFPTVCPRKNICADEYTLRVRPRFHVPGMNSTADRVELPEDEAEHLVRVLRLGVGDQVDVFDGRGGLWRAEIVQVGKKSAAVRPIEPGTPARELGVQLSLVVSVLKGDKIDDVVRDAVMLGVTSIRPVISERSEIGLAAHGARARGSRDGSGSPWRRPSSADAQWSRRFTMRRRSIGTCNEKPDRRQGDVRRAVRGARRGPSGAIDPEIGRGGPDHRAGRRLGGVGSRRRSRFWRYPDVARQPHAPRGRGADCGVDCVDYDLG